MATAAARVVSERVLILGSANGYPPEYLRPFLDSLARSGYRGHIALVVAAADRSRLARTPGFEHVRLVGAPQWLPWRLGLLHGRRRRIYDRVWQPLTHVAWRVVLRGHRRQRAGRLAKRLYAPPIARYMYFLDIVRAGDYDRVLLSDVRDVVFQSDPFTQLPRDGIAVSVETRDYTIAEEPYNRGWIRDGYGEQMVRRIGDNAVICSGVTAGDNDAMLAYLERMVSETLAISPRDAIDQAIHNVLVWTGALEPCTLMETLDSAVATLNNVAPAAIELGSDGRLLNRDGRPPSVVHQYDRVPGLEERLLPALLG